MKHSALYTLLAVLLLALTACNDDTPAPPTPLVPPKPPKEIHKIDYDSDHVYHLGDDLKIGGMGGCWAYQAIFYKQQDGKYAVALQNVCDHADFKEAGLTGTIEQDVVPGAKSIILSTVPEEETCQIFGEGETPLVTYSISGEIRYNDELKKHIMHLKSDVKLKDSQNVMPLIFLKPWGSEKVLTISLASKKVNIGGKTIDAELLFNKILDTPFVYAGNYGKEDVDDNGHWVIVNDGYVSLNYTVNQLFDQTWFDSANPGFGVSMAIRDKTSDYYYDYDTYYPFVGFCSSVKTSEKFEDKSSDTDIDNKKKITTYTGSITLFPSLISLQNNENPEDIPDGLEKIIKLIRVNFYKYCIKSKIYANGLKLDATYSDMFRSWRLHFGEQDDPFSEMNLQKRNTRANSYFMDYTYTLDLMPDPTTGITLFKELLYPVLSDPANIKAISNNLAKDSELGLTAQEIENFILSMPGLATESNNFQLKFSKTFLDTSNY